MFGAWLGHFYDKPLEPLARKVKFNPNIITVAGFAVTALGAFVVSKYLFLGGLVIGIGSLLDMFDGVVARAHGRESKFGAFLDSVLDRYADALIFIGLAWYLAGQGDHAGALLCLGTWIGAFAISYTRARAEGLDIKCETGIMERPERIVMLVFGALTGWIVPVLWIMLFLTHFTAFQRVYHVWRAIKSAE
jgi:phosphatidylglycerophosphate synthase